MPRIEIITKNDLRGCNSRLVFSLGSGLYLCFPSWHDFLNRDRSIDTKISEALSQRKMLDEREPL